MFEELFGLGGYLGGANPNGTSESRPANFVEGWQAALRNPATQAALMAAGTQLMAPRWNRASALPDAIQSAGTAVAAEQGYQDQRADKEAQQEEQVATRRQRETEGAANRANAVRVAEIGADSRAEVAGIRAVSMLERAQLGGGAKTPFEQRKFTELVGRYTTEAEKFWRNSVENIGKQPAPEMLQLWRRAAEERAETEIIAGRVRGTALVEGGQNPQTNTSGNLVNRPAPVPSPGSTQPGAGMSGNSVNTGNAQPAPSSSSVKSKPATDTRPTVEDLRARATPEQWSKWMQDPDAVTKIKRTVRDPGNVIPGAGDRRSRGTLKGINPALEER